MDICFWKSWLLVLILSSPSYSLKLRDYYKERAFQCEPIQEQHCAGLGYNYTTMPNIMGDENQKEASSRFLEFKPLMQYQYSEKFHFFLCTLFFPMCTEKVNVGIPACRPMCEDMRREKGPIMKTLGFEWSDSIDCSKLPWESVEDHLCIPHPSYDPKHKENNIREDDKAGVINPPLDEPKLPTEEGFFSPTETDLSNTDEEDEIPPHQPIVPHLSDPINPSVYETPEGSFKNPYPVDRYYDDPDSDNDNDEYNFEMPEPPDDTPPSPESTTTPLPTPAPKCKNLDKFVYVEKTGLCTPRCDRDVDVLFSAKDKHNAFLVQTICALLCFVSTAITIATFFIDSKRFRYPERPVMFLSICYNVYSVGYLMRSLKGFHSPPSCLYNSSIDANHLVTSGHKDTSCYASFFILYFFGMAASAWWVILNITFLLSAGFKWGHEAIERFGIYFHFLAWTLPLLQTIAVLLLAKIDGDELTGICYVGNMDSDALMYFVIIPLMFYLLIGSITLVLGISYLFKILRVMKHQNIDEACNLEKLIKKISIFSMFYAIPAACVLAANFYQYQHFSQWLNDAQNTPCFPNGVQHHFYGPPSSNRRYFYKQPHHDRNPRFFTSWSVGKNDPGLDAKSELYDSDHFIRKRNAGIKKTSLSQNDFNDEIPLDCHLQESAALYLVYFFKISMSLLPGLMCGIWIGSAKTFESWSKFFNSCKCRKKRKQNCHQLDENQTLYPSFREVIGSSMEETENTFKRVSSSEEGSHLLTAASPNYQVAGLTHQLQRHLRGKRLHNLPQNCCYAPESQCLGSAGAQAIAFMPRNLYDPYHVRGHVESSDDVFIRSYHVTSNHQSNRKLQSRRLACAKLSSKQPSEVAAYHSNNRLDDVSYLSFTEMGHPSYIRNVDKPNRVENLSRNKTFIKSSSKSVLQI